MWTWGQSQPANEPSRIRAPRQPPRTLRTSLPSKPNVLRAALSKPRQVRHRGCGLGRDVAKLASGRSQPHLEHTRRSSVAMRLGPLIQGHAYFHLCCGKACTSLSREGFWPRHPDWRDEHPSGRRGGHAVVVRLEPYRPRGRAGIGTLVTSTGLPGASSGQNPPRRSRYLCTRHELYDSLGQVPHAWLLDEPIDYAATTQSRSTAIHERVLSKRQWLQRAI
jgi:hypothetical protein